MSADLDIRHIAGLARLALTDEETATFGAQLGRVLEHVELLKKVDVSAVEPMSHTHAVFNVTREDVPGGSLAAEVVLGLAPRQANQLVLVPKVVE